ncbi:glycosyltransferase [Nocardia inohanensis]|uniref:glycosyltransferase n=1 Tax=Nocardia inohanensis TaxID=209246 RepID=UPI0009FBB316|nr:nucleotide disphospho-sugar-binding domain-containing protein [Nocardia inohanensis]
MRYQLRYIRICSLGLSLRLAEENISGWVGKIRKPALCDGFPSAAAVVHHGGAGTTAAVAASGTPRVVVPQMFDQYCRAAQVERLGIGVAHASRQPTVESLTAAVARVLSPRVWFTARTIGPQIDTDGAARAARRVLGAERV